MPGHASATGPWPARSPLANASKSRCLPKIRIRPAARLSTWYAYPPLAARNRRGMPGRLSHPSPLRQEKRHPTPLFVPSNTSSIASGLPGGTGHTTSRRGFLAETPSICLHPRRATSHAMAPLSARQCLVITWALSYPAFTGQTSPMAPRGFWVEPGRPFSRRTDANGRRTTANRRLSC